MVDEAYVKSIEADNEKLRQKLSDTQELLDVAEERLRVADLQDNNEAYNPLDNEVVDGFRLHSVTEAPITDSLLFTCVKNYRSFFGKKKQKVFMFRIVITPTAGKRFSTSYSRYPDGRDLDYSDMDMWLALAKQMFEVARQNRFITVANVTSGGYCIAPYWENKKKKRFLRNGLIQYEAS
jgi:hypothetical protein